MNNHSDNINEDDIDLREVFKTIRSYKYSILLFIVLATLVASIYAYMSQNIYNTYTKVEISPNKNQSKMGPEDILAMVMDGGSVNADTEIEIVKSVSLVKRAAKNVDISHHYSTTRNFKNVELYKDSPFEVGMLKGFNLTFTLYPVDYTQYRLVIEEAKDINGTEWSYDEIHDYQDEVVTEHFHINIVRSKEMLDSKYYFLIDGDDEAARKIHNNISVEQKTKKSSILTISYNDSVPLRAQEFTNALAQAYVDRSVEKKTKEAELKLSFINKQLKHITNNLNSSASKLEEFKRNANTVDLSENSKKIINQMSDMEVKLSEITIKEKLLKNLSQEIKSGESIESISVTGLSNAYSGQTPLTTMISDLQKATIKKKKLSSDFTSVHPEIKRINKEVLSLKRIIGTTIRNLNKNILGEKEYLEATIAKQQKYLNTLPADERILGELKRKFEVSSKVYSYLLKKQSETAMIKASTLSQIDIVDKAFYPKNPIEPKRMNIVIIGMIVGLLLGLLFAFMRAYLDNRIKGEDDVKEMTKLPLLGAITTIKENKNDAKRIKSVSSPKSSVAEGFRALRTNLQFMNIESKCHVITVTSTVGGEGKSTISTNLAAIMGTVGKKTIVVNMDMRKPTIHEKLGVLNTKGISSYLSNQYELEDIILGTEYDNLDAITSGPIPPNPGELIQSKMMVQLLDELRSRYDVVILDTPPVGLVSDARTLMRYADTILYVARVDYSKKSFLNYIKKLSQEEIKKLGIVVNDIDLEEDGFGYGYGYYEED
ncbi:MAG: polysaccharide biosynthesis tyrosine autokinase [Sulfurovum sp.]|nr:polysaccharide biosynthesis tyrosine autokinase [Sulfurovum sp.]